MASHTAAVHGLSELLCGLAGLIEASRLMSGQPTAGRGYELQVACMRYFAWEVSYRRLVGRGRACPTPTPSPARPCEWQVDSKSASLRGRAFH